MDGIQIDASMLVTTTTIAVALVGLFFQGVKLSADRSKDREERAGQMAKTDAKLDEVNAIYSKATTQEKQEGYKLLSNLFPGSVNRFESLRN